MIHYPAPYDDLATTLQAGNHAFEVACRLGVYTDDMTQWIRESQITQLTTTDTLFGASNPCIGSAVSRQINISYYVGYYSDDPTQIVWDYPVWLATRIVNTDDPTTRTAWFTQGPWFEQSRRYDPLTGVLSITAYDRMSESDSEYMLIDEDATASFCRNCFVNGATTATAQEVFADIAGILHLSGVSSRAVAAITAAGNPTIQRPDDTTTMRDIMRWIAGICAGAAMVAWHEQTSGTLDIVPVNNAGELVTLGSKMGQLRISSSSHTSDYWDVCFETDDGDVYSNHVVGQHTQTVTTRFQMSNPLGTQALADHALSILRTSADGTAAWVYHGFQARDALLDIRAEVGDRISIDYPNINGLTETFTGVIGEIQRTYDRACVANVSAPDLARKTRGKYEIEDE